MSSEIAHLPDTMERQWRVYAANLRKIMGDSGVDSETVEIALTRVKPIFIRCSKPKKISEGSNQYGT